MKKENAKGPIVLGRLPTCPALPPIEFAKAVKDSSVQLIDNRQMLAFGGGHIEGALNIGPRAELSIWAGWMLDPEKPIYLVLRQDTDLPEVQRQFIRVGYYKFGGYLLGGMEEWNNNALPIKSIAQMDVHDLNAAMPFKFWMFAHLANVRAGTSPDQLTSSCRNSNRKPSDWIKPGHWPFTVTAVIEPV
jgi:hydroxyacylglutathione hydrolase